MHRSKLIFLSSRLYVFVVANLSLDAFVFGHLCRMYILLQ